VKRVIIQVLLLFAICLDEEQSMGLEERTPMGHGDLPILSLPEGLTLTK
jgi:hypothetical protein